jgi:hypothetical protein
VSRRGLVARDGKPGGPARFGLEKNGPNRQRRQQLKGGLGKRRVVEPHDVIGVIVRHFDVRIVPVTDLMGLDVTVRRSGDIVVGVTAMGVRRSQPPPERHDRRDEDARDSALNCPQVVIIVARPGAGQLRALAS